MVDRWIFGFAIFAVVAVGVIASSPVLLSQNQQYIVDKIDTLSDQRQNESDVQRKKILDNLSNKIDANTAILEHVIEKMNITVNIDSNQTEELETSGSISGFGKPEIIPH